MQAFCVGHLQIEKPLRLSDLVHTRNATLARTEELLALDRIELSRVEPCPWGFLVKPRLSQRFADWAKSLRTTLHLWMDSVELDPYGTELFLSHEFIAQAPANPFQRPINRPFAGYALVCSWRDAPPATAHLRREYIAPALLTTYGATELFSITSGQITHTLGLPEGSLNSNALPHYCQTEWGIVLRIDRDNVQRVLEYFNAEEPADPSVPTVGELGGLIQSVYAFSSAQESLRLALCPEHLQELAIHDLGHWLRSVEFTNSKKRALATT